MNYIYTNSRDIYADCIHTYLKPRMLQNCISALCHKWWRDFFLGTRELRCAILRFSLFIYIPTETDDQKESEHPAFGWSHYTIHAPRNALPAWGRDPWSAFQGIVCLCSLLAQTLGSSKQWGLPWSFSSLPATQWGWGTDLGNGDTICVCSCVTDLPCDLGKVTSLLAAVIPVWHKSWDPLDLNC